MFDLYLGINEIAKLIDQIFISCSINCSLLNQFLFGLIFNLYSVFVATQVSLKKTLTLNGLSPDLNYDNVLILNRPLHICSTDVHLKQFLSTK